MPCRTWYSVSVSPATTGTVDSPAAASSSCSSWSAALIVIEGPC